MHVRDVLGTASTLALWNTFLGNFPVLFWENNPSNDLQQPAPFLNDPRSVAVERDGVTGDMNTTSSPSEDTVSLALSCVSDTRCQRPRADFKPWDLGGKAQI